MSLNKVMLIGHLGDKPMLHQRDDGQQRVGLSVVTTMQGWFDVQTGEERHRDEWHRVVITQPDLVELAMQDLSLDDQIYIEGQLQTQCWRDQTFEWRSLTHIVLSRDSDQLRRLCREERIEDIDTTFQTTAHTAAAKGTSTQLGRRPERLDHWETSHV